MAVGACTYTHLAHVKESSICYVSLATQCSELASCEASLWCEMFRQLTPGSETTALTETQVGTLSLFTGRISTRISFRINIVFLCING